jgi:hypothetical protein
MKIPNSTEIGGNVIYQAQVDSRDIDVITAALNGAGVITGGAVTAQTTPNMTVQVAAGIASHVSTLISFAAVSSLAITAADATNPRRDLVVVDTAGTVSVKTGTPAGIPLLPTFNLTTEVVLAEVTVPANTTSIPSTHIVDKRMTISPIGTIERQLTTTTIVNSAVETDILNKTILGGLMATNRKIRVTISGNVLNNTGANTTFTLRIYFGGTVIYSDSTSSVATSASRRPFYIQFEIQNSGAANVNKMGGLVLIGAAGGLATGLGDIGAAGLRESPIAHGATDLAINTANNQIVRVSIQLSTANAAHDFVAKYSTIELV